MTAPAAKSATVSESLLQFLGSAVFIFAIQAGSWFAARHLAWWTYGLSFTGWYLACGMVKSAWKARRRDR